MRVVIAGFGPFPGAPSNPSGLLAKALAKRRRPALATIIRTAHVFATGYAAVDRDLPKLLSTRPDIVLLFGLAARRRELCIETRARNAVSVLFPDAQGFRPPTALIARGAPTSRHGEVPFMRLFGAARSRNVPARLSRDAGRYLCNYIYWQALQQTRGGKPLVAFIHIPPIPNVPRRLRQRHHVTLPQLVETAEALLIALASASRR